MCFDDNCAETLESISKSEKSSAGDLRVSSQTRDVTHSKSEKAEASRVSRFRYVTRITPAAALVLAAEFERMKILTGNPPVVVNVGSWSPQVFD